MEVIIAVAISVGVVFTYTRAKRVCSALVEIYNEVHA